TFYADADGDTYGNVNSTTLACSAPTGYVSNSTDCNDANAAIHPNATETCNGIDDNCNGQVDEGVKTTFYADADGDTYGNVNSTTLACSAPTGYVSNSTDCNDANAAIHPNATETCNGIDDNCNGQVDEGVKTTFYADADGDTYGNVNSTTLACSAPTGYVSNSTDCNDANAAIHPNATETCNGIDDNCNGTVDEGVKTTFYADADGDTYGNVNSTTLACSAPTGYVSNSTDCNDANASIHPNATETCNGIDDNCNGTVDEGVKTTFYADADGDTYGNLNSTTLACSAPTGYVSNSTDCNDANASIHPGASEQCNSIDDNCNGQIDDGVVFNNYYADNDHDSYGATLLGSFCVAPANSSLVAGDCNDANAAVHPNATETCNGIDDNCNGTVDEGVKTTFYADADADTYGNVNSTTLACSAPTGYVSNSTDCNDANAAIHPNATETCNGIDDNCNGQVDEGVKTTFYADADGDTYGNVNSTTLACSAPAGYVSNSTDCNDGNAAVHPNATETCNGIDDNCNGQVDEGVKTTFYADADGDTYGNVSSTTLACSAPSGYVSNSTDCNDANAAVHPNATEVCNSIDDNCNGTTDEGCGGSFTYYADTDNDLYGNPNSSITSSSSTPPAGYVANNTDCNDANAAIHPGVADVCNSIDDNCNGTVDENAITATVTPAGSVSFCKGAAFSLTASGGTGLTYQWLKGSQNIAGATNQTYSPTKTASYKVKETNSFNCSSTSPATSVTVLAQPTATITPQGNLDICATGSVVLQANAGSGFTYQWLKGTTTIAGATNQNYTATVKATYKVIVTNSSGCSKTSAGAKVTKSCKEDLAIDVNSPASFLLYPNPSDGSFVADLQLQNSFSGNATLSIMNTLGQIILQKEVAVSDGTVIQTIHLSNDVAAGMYIVNVVADDNVFTTQLMINR
ncbi:MAG TPA: MopE-related protein, partial [Chitinophagales bacterium]|nr:MopE-related protein [Chitinophagales bacterium]